MSKQKKNKKTVIPPEKMAVLSERGLKAARLTKEEKRYLLDGGLKELYDIWEFKKQTISSLESEAIDMIINKFFCKQPRLWVRITRKIIEMVKPPVGLDLGSPVFVHRGKGDKRISFHKKAGNLIVHLEIVQTDKMLADINVCLTDDSGNSISPFEVELFKGERCIETVYATKSTIVSLFAIEAGDYFLQLSDSNGEITLLIITIEK